MVNASAPRRAARPFERPPLDRAALDALALGYVARYATTSGKLADYLRRKVRERGWAGEDAPPVEAVVAHAVDRGFVDDRAWAEGRRAGLLRRGYGEGRVRQALAAAGIEAELRAALPTAENDAAIAAERFARRRRIGRWGDGESDPDRRRRQLAAMLRAGHPLDLARRVVAGEEVAEL